MKEKWVMRGEGGGQIYHQEGFQFDAARSNSAATPPSHCLGEAEGSSVDTSRCCIS